MPEKTSLQRVAFSPGEFAALFGRQQTWGYRQIYAGKVKAITKHGRILIPTAEVERVLASASRYEGKKKPPARSRAELEAMTPALQSAWEIFVNKKRQGKGKPSKSAKAANLPSCAVNQPNSRKAAIRRIFGSQE